MARCLDCLAQKTKIYFDIERARSEAKKQAVQNEKTFALYKEKNVIAFAEIESVRAKGYTIIEVVSKYP